MYIYISSLLFLANNHQILFILNNFLFCNEISKLLKQLIIPWGIVCCCYYIYLLILKLFPIEEVW